MAKKKASNRKMNANVQGRKKTASRTVRLTPKGASLALYHAALSDPFSSPATFVPHGTRPGTFVHKRMHTYVAPSSETNFRIRLWSQGAQEWKIGMYGGTTALMQLHSQVISNPGKCRIVGAAVRVTDIGQADSLGGLATLYNTHSEPTFHDHKHYTLFKKSVTAYFKPVYPTDYTWYGGNTVTDNDGYGGLMRDFGVELNAAVNTKSFVEYCIIFEADEQIPELEGSGNYLVSRKMNTHDAGPDAKAVAQKAIDNMKQRNVDMSNHASARGPTHPHRVREGIKAAAETGATVMGVTETISPGSVSGPFKRFLGLGEATGAEIEATAAEALPMLEAAGEYLPLALL